MRGRFGLYLNRKSIAFVVTLTVSVLLALTVFITFSIGAVNRMVTQYCFDELAETSKSLAEDLRNSIENDRTILSAIAEIIAGEEDQSPESLCGILNAYSLESSYMSYMELLYPDGWMLSADGETRDVSAAFDFEKEAAAGAYVSHMSQGVREANEKVIRNVVPVIRDGRTVYMLFGVVRMSDLARQFTTSIYGGHAYVYIEDGDTGDFLLDTWHQSFGNVNDLGQRKTLPGYDLNQSIADMRRGVGGEIGFVSRTTGEALYMRYDPIGINGWNVIITAEEQYALEKGAAISQTLYVMTGVIGAVLLLYVSFMTFFLFKAYRQAQRLGTFDQTTELKNRNAYDQFVADRQRKIFPSLVCVYVDVNGLHDVNNKFGHTVGDRMLRTVADALKRAFGADDVYRIGGDEFIAFSGTLDEDACRRKMQEAVRQIEMHRYSISYGIVGYLNETGVDRAIREADEQMLANKREYYRQHDRRKKG